MSQSNDSTKSTKEDIDAIKNDIENIIKKISHLKYKSGDVISEQIDHLSSVIHQVKNKSEKQGSSMLHELCDSTQKHPMRNVLCALALGAVISLIIS